MILWSLYLEFFVWEFSVILLRGFCALCIGNFLFAGIGCVDYVVSVLEILCFGNFLLFCCVDSVHSVLGIFCLQELVVWIMWALNWEFSICRNCYVNKVMIFCHTLRGMDALETEKSIFNSSRTL